MVNYRKHFWVHFYSHLCWVLILNLCISEGRGDTNSDLENNSKYNESSNHTFDKSDYYVAAVIDYSPIFWLDYGTAVLMNLQRHIGIIKESKKYMVDIVVFPECGLYACIGNRNTILKSAVYIPSAAEMIVSCQFEIKSQVVLRDLSCAAQESHIYVAAVLMEKYCSKENGTCSNNELLLYNTQVVFDRNGMIIARYRKYNLYTERWTYGVNQTQTPEMSTFITDFNVKFGQMICFDLMFTNPGVSLIKRYNVTQMIHSAAMMSRLPFIAVSSMEAGWSYSMDTVLLASTLSSTNAILGTNIYFARREYTRTYVTSYEFSKIIISLVPKTHSVPLHQYPPSFENLPIYNPIGVPEYAFLVEHMINNFTMEPMLGQGSEPRANFIYISDTFQCNISVTWMPSNDLVGLPNYQLLAYSGPTNYSLASVNNYAEMCGMVLCKNGDVKSCKLPPRFYDSSKITITSLNLSAVSRSPYDLRIPITLGSDLLALDVSLFKFDSSVQLASNGESFNIVNMELVRPTSDIVTFGIYKFLQILNPSAHYSQDDANKNADVIYAS